MSTFKTLLFAFLLVFVTGSAIAQQATNFQGSWYGTDQAGNTVELTLNADYSCVLKINGNAAFNITGYKFMRSGAQAALDEIAADKEVWFYTSIATTSNNISLSEPTVGKYDGTARLTDAVYKNLTVSINVNAGSQAQVVTYNLSR